MTADATHDRADATICTLSSLLLRTSKLPAEVGAAAPKFTTTVSQDSPRFVKVTNIVKRTNFGDLIRRG